MQYGPSGNDPITGLSATNNSPTILGNTTRLTATVTGGTNIVYTWAFGDGTTGSGANVSRTYLNGGNYTAVVTASNAINTVTATTRVTITTPSPVANFNGSPPSGITPLTVTFVNSSTNASSYRWNYGNGATSTTTAITHTYVYTQPGVYTVSLAASNGTVTNILTRTNYITAYAPVIANFSASPLTGTVPLTVTFTNSSTGATEYLWDFGDNLTSTVTGPTHVYTQAGIYTVSLRASNPASSHTLTAYITASPAVGPITGLSAANDSPTELGQSTTLTATISAGSGDISYTWALGDGATGSGAVVSHIYPAVGDYTAVVTAANSVSVVTATTTVVITGTPALTISKTGPATAIAGEPITYTLTVTNEGTLTATNLLITDVVPTGATYVSGGTSNGAVVTWTVPSLGSGEMTQTGFVVTATQTITNSDYAVSADGGVSAVGQAAVTTVVYQPPVALFSASPLTGTAPLTVTFVNSSTNATDYLWNFGDGASQTVANPSHIYDEPGVYTVSLKASGLGGIDILTRTHYITAYEPVIADFWAEPVTGTIPLTVTFTSTSTGTSTLLWDFGDGDTQTITSSLTTTHTYTQAGVYTVTLTASGPGGSETLTRTHYITAYEPVVADFWAEPLSGTVPLTVTFVNSSTGAADYRWDFGDTFTLAITNVTTSPLTTTHVYTQAGIYTVTLTAQGASDSDTLTRTHYLTVVAPLELDFSASPPTGNAPLTVTLVASATAATGYTWDFGDAITLAITNVTTNPLTTTHVYTQARVYTVTLTASNDVVTETLTKTNYLTVTAPITRNWQLITTTLTPPVSGEHAMAYDPDRNAVVLYGGNADGWPYEDTTWEFDGTDWITVTTTTTPTARYGSQMAYLPGPEGGAILFGGSDESDTALDQTWVYTNSAWTQLTITGTVPASRTYHSLASNPISGTVYLFGGNPSSGSGQGDGETYFDDLWQYQNGVWTELPSAVGGPPSPRTLAAMTYDTATNRLLLFGGRTVTTQTTGTGGTLLADLWAFDPDTNTWTELDDGGGGGGPPPRMAHTLTYDPDTGNLILVGGVADVNGDTLLGDVWHYNGDWTQADPAAALPPRAYHQAVFAGNAVFLFSAGEVWQYE